MSSQIYGRLANKLRDTFTHYAYRIIVGVKYCFRYNQRNRARLAGDDPDAVDLAAMPRQRRRREKKLMTMEEVNEKFPLTKYKTWRSTRAEEGLPTAGGITTAPSRAASVKNLPRVSEDENSDAATSATPEVLSEKITPSEPSSPVTLRHEKPATDSDDKKTATATVTAEPSKPDADGEDADDQIQTAIPAEQLPDPGDTCAICIDALEDDDDIRGLTCGHAFHASCVDPWLTSRRACCPLCKADYFTPKPRPEGEVEELRRRPTREELPPTIFGTRGRGPPLAIFNRHFGPRPQREQGRRQALRSDLNAMARQQSRATVGSDLTANEQTQQQSSWRTRLNLPRLPALGRVRNGAANQPGEQPTTPAQLEAGQNR